MPFQDYFSIWEKLEPAQQNRLLDSLIARKVEKGTVIHNGSMDCTGLLVVESGQLRAYILSDEGREITLYRLFDRDICLLSASCMIPRSGLTWSSWRKRTRGSGLSPRRFIRASWNRLRRRPTSPMS